MQWFWCHVSNACDRAQPGKGALRPAASALLRAACLGAPALPGHRLHQVDCVCWQHLRCRLPCAGADVASCSPVAHPGGVTALRALPGRQGSLAVSAGKDLQLALWRLPSKEAIGAAASKGATGRPQAHAWQQVASYSGHKAAVECVAPSPDGARIASGGWDSNLFVWQTGAHLVCCWCTLPFDAIKSSRAPFRAQSCCRERLSPYRAALREIKAVL